MKTLHAGCLTATCLSAALTTGIMFAGASSARAQETVAIESSSPAAVDSSRVLPNRPLLRSGLFTLGVSYVPALVVAVESDQPADEHLYAPVVGPWLDLAERDCESECEGETVDQMLLVTDGVFQGLGALQVLGSFIFPETRAAAVTIANGDGTPAVSFRVMPTQVARGNGLVAFGEF